MEEYKCIHCEGISQIAILKNTEKATEPTVEFCPFFGMSNQYLKEIENEY